MQPAMSVYQDILLTEDKYIEKPEDFCNKAFAHLTFNKDSEHRMTSYYFNEAEKKLKDDSPLKEDIMNAIKCGRFTMIKKPLHVSRIHVFLNGCHFINDNKPY